MGFTHLSVFFAKKFSNMDNVPMAARFEEELGIHTVMQRDASMLLYYDLYINRSELSAGICSFMYFVHKTIIFSCYNQSIIKCGCYEIYAGGVLYGKAENSCGG